MICIERDGGLLTSAYAVETVSLHQSFESVDASDEYPESLAMLVIIAGIAHVTPALRPSISILLKIDRQTDCRIPHAVFQVPAIATVKNGLALVRRAVGMRSCDSSGWFVKRRHRLRRLRLYVLLRRFAPLPPATPIR
jgi:hypothetical protein